MSWKSFVTAGLLCVLATPAFAQPNLGIIKGGTVANGNLNASGQWVWNVQVTPALGLVPDSSGTPIGIEAGFSSTSTGAVAGQGNVIGAARINQASNFDTLNPGTVIFPAWQTSANGLLDAGSNNRPTGLQINAPGIGATAGASYTTNSSVSGTANQVFAALGSVNYTSAGAKDVLSINTARPVVTLANPNTSNTIKVSGVYGTGSTNGRLVQVTGGTAPNYTTSNFDTFGGNTYSYTRNARGGDTDLNGAVDFNDFQLGVLLNYNQSGKSWQAGDFDGNGTVSFDDFQILLTQYNTSYTVGIVSPGAGSGLEGAGVPEPASAALLGLAAIGGLGIFRRKR